MSRTSSPREGHRIYPYLLRGMPRLYITKGFLYLGPWTGIAARRWRTGYSNTMDAAFCVEAMEEAIVRFGAPEVFNTDQGAQSSPAR